MDPLGLDSIFAAPEKDFFQNWIFDFEEQRQTYYRLKYGIDAPIDVFMDIAFDVTVTALGGRVAGAVGNKCLKKLPQKVKSNWFRGLENGPMKANGKTFWANHFHFDPVPGSKELMQLHLPQQRKQWFYTLKAKTKRGLSKLKNK